MCVFIKKTLVLLNKSAHTNTYFGQNQLLGTDLSATFKRTCIILTEITRKLSQIAHQERREKQALADKQCPGEMYPSFIFKGDYRDTPF